MGSIVLIGIVFGFMLLAYEDGVRFSLFKKLMCQFGWHSLYNSYGGMKVQKYYCQVCGKGRKHPDLKVVDGGKKIGNNRFKF